MRRRHPIVQAGDAVYWRRGRWTVMGVARQNRVALWDGFQQAVVLAEQLTWEASLDGWLMAEEEGDAWA